MEQPSASIDVGTNTVRLLIADAAKGYISPLLIKRHITRLGGGFSREHGISPEAADRTIAALLDFSEELNSNGVAKVKAVATSAVRDAVNGALFCERAFRESGIRLEIISGEQEALFTLRGVLAGIDQKTEDFLIFDVGGGSTEYIYAHGAKPLFASSLPLGVVRLTEGKENPSAISDKICRELDILVEQMRSQGVHFNPIETTLVATAGTATTLAAIDLKMTDYDYRLVNNHTMTLSDIEDIFSRLLPLSTQERLLVSGLEKGREDLIIAGTLITIHSMRKFGFNKLKISDFGLLEGVLLSAEI